MANVERVGFKDFDPTYLTFGGKAGDKAKPYIPISYKGKRLQIQTPLMNMPFGLSAYKQENVETKIEDNSIQLPFNTGGADVEDFRVKMEAIDAKLLDTVEQLSPALYGKQKSREVLEENQSKLVKTAKKQEYGQSIRIKWPKSGEPTFWNAQRELRTSDICMPGCDGYVIFEISMVWFVNSSFGVRPSIVQVLVSKQPEDTNGCGFTLPSPPPKTPMAEPTPIQQEEGEEYEEDGF